MKNKYVDFVSDDHFLKCVANLHTDYLKAKNNVTKKHFYSNKVDTIKLTFDAKFNAIDEESLIRAEILRQIDKSINNSIGTFHEQILGGIAGFEVGNLSGFDIKATDGSLFAIFKFEHLPKNIEDCIFEKLSKNAQIFKKSKFYLVDFTIKNHFKEKWIIGNDEYSVSHKNVFMISGHSFYDVISETDETFKKLEAAVLTIPNEIKVKI
ncbi:Eco47II family restriction endonuclease [Flavobacterium branchiophilum]|uniref:Restriction endonuclease n=1 Tax=Flavobacterium branchiophilum TaxID=55197 RepID=A0A2H3KSU3_9FLAO|nr:Eco47II family restriction endonuclease [Flavobacterium branchiophilum]PDS25390.1 restriction endonuclease [Flavobacterium branchiophilum]